MISLLVRHSTSERNPSDDLCILRCNSIPVALQFNFDSHCKAFPLCLTTVIYSLSRGASSPSILCNLEEWTQALVAIHSSKVMSPRTQWRPLFLVLQLLYGSYQHVCVLLHTQQVSRWCFLLNRCVIQERKHCYTVQNSTYTFVVFLHESTTLN